MKMKIIYPGIFAAFFLLAGNASPAAATQVTLTGDQQQTVTADANGKYAFVNLPLRSNSVNRFTVTAGEGENKQSREVNITQISLQSVVVSKIKAEPLSVQEIEQLVNDGVIDITDPANFNVSKFEIVLTIGKEQVPISIPIVQGVQEPMGYEIIPMPNDPGSGGQPSNPQNVEVIVFEMKPQGGPGQPDPPSIPGVIIIEGRIKTLKEFYSVRLLLMNTSGIFTLHDVTGNLEFPDGGLSHTLPSDGIVQFGDILPGDADVPGQKEREFIIRGDEIGIRKVRVNFGGSLIGGGIPEEEFIPFNGSAETTVEVKGPPEFRVQVIHPPAVVKNVPYELLVNIQNIGETPALYTSFELDVAASAELVDCKIDTAGTPSCQKIEGSAVRNIGHLLPGQATRQSFMVNPLDSGPITSCMSISDQNIDLQVFVGAIGCLTGQRAPAKANPDGIPTVSILPTANALGVSIESPVTAFFNEKMNTGTISTGEGGTFNIFDDAGERVPGRIQFVTISDHTVAIWQVNDGVTNRLKGNTTYTVSLGQTISDLQGNTLESPWVSEFTTTDPLNDKTPPTLTLSVEPPVDPNKVLSGQIIRFNAYAADQGTGVSRVEFRRQDTAAPELGFELIDQKTIFPTSSGPVIFSVDSAELIPGHTYQFRGTAFDKAGNPQDATLAVILAQNTLPPTIKLPADLAVNVLQGISVTVSPEEISGGVTSVDYFLDTQSVPFKTVTLAPFSATLGTLNLPLGQHTIKAVAMDGIGQKGQDTFSFNLAANPNEPLVDFGGAVDGARYVAGIPISINGSARDPLGISNVAFYLDNTAGAPIATSTEPFTIDTTGLGVGVHKIFFKAVNRLGVANNFNHPDAILEFEILPLPPAGVPPAAPIVLNVTAPENGETTLTGTSVAGARIDITNLTQGLLTTVTANASGAFQALLSANGKDQLSLVALDLKKSPTPSAAAKVSVPEPLILNSLTVTPPAKNFTALNQTQGVTVTAFYAGNITKDVTQKALFSSSNPAAVSVSGEGVLAALANGDASIAVSFGGKQAVVQVNVNAVTMTGIALTPNIFNLTGINKTQQMTAKALFSNGTSANLPVTDVTFTSSNPLIAAVNASGLVTSKGIGEAMISAAASGFPPVSAQVKVEPVVPASITVSPGSILFTQIDETRQLVVTVNFSDGTTASPQGAVQYSSSDPLVASVNAAGLVKALKEGSATLTVDHLGFSKTVSVDVDITPTSPPPKMDSLDRPRAAEGDILVIRGENFSALPEKNKVKVNGVFAAVQAARHDELAVIIPDGASTGLVTVEVDTQVSNGISLGIYARTAESFLVTQAVDMPALAGAKLNLPGPVIDFRAGDKVFLSSAPDILAPLSFEGALRAKIDGGAFFAIPVSAQAPDLTASFAAGERIITLELSESGGKFKTTPIYVVAGPNATGAIAGVRSVMANSQSRPTPVTFINLKDANGVALPNGSKVVVTASSVCFRDPVTNGCIPSHGGSITNGEPSPDGFGLKAFTVTNGRIDVIYDPETAPGLNARESAAATIQVLPANALNNRTSDRALVISSVTLTSFDTVGTTRSQSSVIADGLQKIAAIHFVSPRDTAGKPVPDGTPFLVTVEPACFRNPIDNSCIASAGGTIPSGDAGPDGFGLRKHLISVGEVTVQYNPGTVALRFPLTDTANLQFLPARPNGTRIGDRAFQITPLTLSSVRTPAFSTPSSVFADTADNRVIINFSNFKDALGNPVPNGTKVLMTSEAHCFRDFDNSCIASAGGVIISGTAAPDGFGLRVHEIQNGMLQVTYSALNLGLQTGQTAVVAVQMLPSRPDGTRIGDQAISVVRFNAAGYQSAAVSASHTAVIADGLSKTVTVSLSNIKDTEGNVVPDGAVVLATPEAQCFRDPNDNSCIPSAGGTITSGAAAAEGFGLKAHVVTNGQVTIQFDPNPVMVPFPEVRTANIIVLPGKPANGNRIGNTAFVIVPVVLSSVQQATASIQPSSILANNADNRSIVTINSIKDGTGNSAPNGSKVAATPEAHCFRDPVDNSCIPSQGGSIASGNPSPEGFGLRVHTVQNGSAQITYSAQLIALEAREAATANVQVLPSQPNGNRIGNRAFLVAPVVLAGYQSADIAGAGQVAPGAQANYIISNLRDTSGNLLPNGSKLVATVEAHCFRDPDTNGCIGSGGGLILNGTASPEGFGLKSFTVQNGQVTIQFGAPSSSTVSVLQLLPARPNDNRIGNRAFALKTISVST